MSYPGTRPAGPILVTGLPRSGTSWVGKMLEASGELVYVNEPMNPRHPPGRSPGVLNAEVQHYFQYISQANEVQGGWLEAFRDTTSLRFRMVPELRRNHRPYDLARAVKYATAFRSGRRAERRALLDDPYALLSVSWFVERLGASAVVLVRDPVSLVGSWRALGWSVDPGELLAQPLLVQDHLEPVRDTLTALAGSDDWLATTCALWCAAYSVVREVAERHGRIHVQRHEDLAREPATAFEGMYEDLGLTWSEATRVHVTAATTGTTTAASGSTRPFGWTVRGGLSRTAFQRMDSRAALSSYQQRLTPEEIRRVLALTADVRQHYYPEAPP